MDCEVLESEQSDNRGPLSPRQQRHEPSEAYTAVRCLDPDFAVTSKDRQLVLNSSSTLTAQTTCKDTGRQIQADRHRQPQTLDYRPIPFPVQQEAVYGRPAFRRHFLKECSEDPLGVLHTRMSSWELGS